MLNLVKRASLYGARRVPPELSARRLKASVFRKRIFTLEDGDILELTPLGGKKAARSNQSMDGLSVGVSEYRPAPENISRRYCGYSHRRQEEDYKLAGRFDMLRVIDTSEYKDMIDRQDIVTGIMNHEGEFASEIGFPDSTIRAEQQIFQPDQGT